MVRSLAWGYARIIAGTIVGGGVGSILCTDSKSTTRRSEMNDCGICRAGRREEWPHLQDAAVDPAEPRRRNRTEQPISSCYRAPIVTKTQLAVYATAQPRPQPKVVCNMNPTNSSYTVSNPDPHFRQTA
ncbi:hypothetical protein L6452_30816 [Arctium lappa]|uniref:Uncharacterized protein n=1 Tax=Arctium lappa TaxID=4217 RepID=A0ACB8ZK67_ARCLA|nr:hypothetical protein L6452_30816 [Arctium lappa]